MYANVSYVTILQSFLCVSRGGSARGAPAHPRRRIQHGGGESASAPNLRVLNEALLIYNVKVFMI